MKENKYTNLNNILIKIKIVIITITYIMKAITIVTTKPG